MSVHLASTASDIDSPLTNSVNDALGRTPYAEHVANIIAAWRGEHSAVFAIYGEWGSGKTSFKNFILEKLKSHPESRQPLVVEFNPWEWEGPRQVTEAFFARLVEDIGDKAPNGADISERLSRYATYLLLKANADFPNVVYLILCDRAVVARNLDDVVAGHGDDYLEKIVQLGLPLPKAYPEQLRTALLGGLQTEIRNAGVERLLDKYRLFNLYDEHAAPFFRTMRDVKRFLASISALLPAVTRDGDAAVDLVDFIGIELLRTFDHELYEAIYCYRARITREGIPSKDKEFIGQLLGKRDQNDPAFGVFGDLFTRFGPARRLARPPRIGHPRTFDRYFLFAVPPDQYSLAEENDVLARRGQPRFVEELEAARKRERLQYLLELLDGAEPPDERDAAINYLSALAAFTETLHLNDGADAQDSYRAQVDRLAYSCLRPLSPAQRADLLVAACEHSQAIGFTARFEEHFRQKEPDALTDHGKDRLREMAVQRLSSSFDTLRSHPAVGDLLLWGLENGVEEGAKAVAEQMLASRESLFDLIYAFSHLDLANIGKARKRVSGFRRSLANSIASFRSRRCSLTSTRSMRTLSLRAREC